MTKLRVLLVDDEPRILEAIQRLLRPLRARWDVEAFTSARAAVDALDARSFDVVVSDMRMPEMDGARFLEIAKDKRPATVRVVLSGQTDKDGALRAATVAHQFLSKPCEPAALVDVLERVERARATLDDPDLGSALAGIAVLPVLPVICVRFRELSARDDTTLAEIAVVVETAPALVVRLLQMVNSSFFGLRRTVCSVEDAIAYLGLELVKTLVLSIGVLEALPHRDADFDDDAFNAHSLLVARIAKIIGKSGAHADACFTAGLFHDIGKLALASVLPEIYRTTLARARASGRTYEEEESDIGGVRHHQLGAYLLNIWGLPWPLVEAVANQDAPEAQASVFGVAGTVHVAHHLCRAIESGAPDDISDETLTQYGLLGNPQWNACALGMGGRG